MSKVIFESQPTLNADEERLVEILGDDSLGNLLKVTLTDFDTVDAFNNSNMDDIDFDNIDFDNVVLATIIGYERAVKAVSGEVRTDLVEIAKHYEDFQAWRLRHGNGGNDESPAHLVKRAELDGIISAYDLILRTSKEQLSEVISNASFKAGQRVAEYRKEFNDTTGQSYSRELEDFGVDFNTGDVVEAIIHDETMVTTLSELSSRLNLEN